MIKFYSRLEKYLSHLLSGVLEQLVLFVHMGKSALESVVNRAFFGEKVLLFTIRFINQ